MASRTEFAFKRSARQSLANHDPGYQHKRLADKAAPKTINLEIGTVRAILRRHRLWAHLQPDIRMFPTPDDIGKALSLDDQKKLVDRCAESRSRSLLPALAGVEYRNALFRAEGGMPFSVVASILGWSPATTARMAKRYGHIGQIAQRQFPQLAHS